MAKKITSKRKKPDLGRTNEIQRNQVKLLNSRGRAISAKKIQQEINKMTKGQTRSQRGRGSKVD